MFNTEASSKQDWEYTGQYSIQLRHGASTTILPPSVRFNKLVLIVGEGRIIHRLKGGLLFYVEDFGFNIAKRHIVRIMGADGQTLWVPDTITDS